MYNVPSADDGCHPLIWESGTDCITISIKNVTNTDEHENDWMHKSLETSNASGSVDKGFTQQRMLNAFVSWSIHFYLYA